ncbi:BtrH N-terminal domain-containing protein [Microbispora sp. NBC_01389]
MTFVKDVEARGMHHCETTALGVLLRHEGLDLSEPMLFGLGSGLSFVYWDAKAMPVPFLGGRVKPFELTRNLTARLGLTLVAEETTSSRRAWENVAASVDAGRPVGLQLDCYHLDYFRTKVHFGGHVVAMYGYDEHEVYLVDTGRQGGAVRTSRAGLARARAERGPMTARNRSFTITVPERPLSWQDQIIPAVRDCADAFLAAPIANLGYRGIEKAGSRVPGWLLRAAEPRRDLPQAALLMERGGPAACSAPSTGMRASAPSFRPGVKARAGVPARARTCLHPQVTVGVAAARCTACSPLNSRRSTSKSAQTSRMSSSYRAGIGPVKAPRRYFVTHTTWAWRVWTPWRSMRTSGSLRVWIPSR